MLWALVIITASIWDGRPTGTNLVGYYETQQNCEAEAHKLGLDGKESTKYSCTLRPTPATEQKE